MTDKTTAPGPTGGESTPAGDAESAKWAELFAEMDDKPAEEEAEPEPTPEPEPTADKASAVEKAKPTYETLETNYKNTTGALKQEREARRRAEDQLQSFNRMVEELRSSRQQRTQPTPEPAAPKIPDVHEDPIGHFQATIAQQNEVINQLRQGSQQTAQQIRAQQEEQAFWGHIQQVEAEFRKTTPTINVNGQEMSDYDAACEHLKAHRMRELAQMYPDESPIAQREAQQYGLPSVGHLRAAMLQQDAIGIAQRAFQLGVSPAQLYYEAAKGRGYATPQASPAPQSNSKTNGKGALQIEAQRKGQKAALTISGGTGRKSDNDLSLSDLSDLYAEDPDEFDKQWERMRKAGKLG